MHSKLIKTSMCTVLLGISAVLSVSAQTVNSKSTFVQKYSVTPNLRYVENGDVAQSLDLYLPKEESLMLRPAVVFVHGGGWVGGDKSEFASNAKELASLGYVAVSINYRLSPKFKYPIPVRDCQAAVRWLRKNASEYKIDPNRIASMGSSAGGHLATMLGVTDEKMDAAGKSISSRVNCVVDYYGRMDLTLEPLSEHHTDFRARFIGSEISDSEAAFKTFEEASPIMHIDKSTPPILIVQGGVDEQVEPVQSDQMFEALQAAKSPVYYLKLGQQGHGFSGEPGEFAWRSAKQFLEMQLQKK